MSLAWYCAIVYPMAELVAEEHLERQGVQPFNPTCRVQRIIRGRKRIDERPLFPGYIFINFDVAEQAWRFINSTRGVRQLISAAPERPTPIRGDAITALIAKCNGKYVDEVEADETLAKFVSVGSAVRPTDGVWEGHVGRVTWTDQERVKALFMLFGRETPVTLDRGQLELI